MQPAGRVFARALVWPLAPLLLLGAVVSDARTPGRTSVALTDVPVIVAMAACGSSARW